MPDANLVVLLVCAALVTALVPGYVLWLRRVSVTGNAFEASRGDAAPHDDEVEVIVAVRDEADGIEDKLCDLAALEEPPGGLTFCLVDGASTDGTPALVARWIRRDPRFRLLRTGRGGKIAQLNAALAGGTTAWVMVTDADARLQPDTVVAIASAAADDPSLAVVGVPVEPTAAHPLERLHWRVLNLMRRAEGRRGCAAIVTGPCYVFRRDLLPDGFPADVIADDVHVAFAGAAAGLRVGFVDRIAAELRSPEGLPELFRHKVRKADAYLREVLRFLPRAPRFRLPAREVFLWRAAQMILFPLLAAAGAAALAVWFLHADAGHAAWVAVACAVALAADAAYAAARRRPALLILGGGLGALLACVLLVAILSMPFSRRTACYPKVAALRTARRAAA